MYQEIYEKIKITKFPVELNDIESIEKNNNLSIRVYGLFEFNTNGDYKNYSLAKLYDGEKSKPKINLLLYKEHFMYIKNISKLLKIFNNSKCKSKVCENCGKHY